MKQVYSPANAAEAHMLAHLLQQNGIQAHIHGEQLQGAVGDLPASNLVQLLVAEEDFDRARELILSWERTQVAEPEVKPGKRFRVVAALVFLLIGIVSGWSLKLAMDGARFTVDASTVSFDQNGDGRDDVTWFYSVGSSNAHRVELDNNFDGRADYVTVFDNFGTPVDERIDQDFDGVFEVNSNFRYGVIRQSEIDTDSNGVADLVQVYEHGVLKRETLTDHRHGVVARINHYAAGRLQSSEADLDRDGFLETVRTYDRYGEVTETTTRSR